MGHISPGGENLLDFLELQQELSTYDLDLRDPLCYLMKGQSPCKLLGALSTGNERGTPVSCHHSQSPTDVSVLSRDTVFPALSRLSSRGSIHSTVARGTALWESLMGKPRGKASRESNRSLDPREGKRDTAATAREESARACPHSRRGLTPLGRLQK